MQAWGQVTPGAQEEPAGAGGLQQGEHHPGDSSQLLYPLLAEPLWLSLPQEQSFSPRGRGSEGQEETGVLNWEVTLWMLT